LKLFWPVTKICCTMIKHILPFLILLAGACRTPVQEEPVKEPDPVREQFIRTNRYMQRRNQDHIAAFVDRMGWKATVTPSGLWIVVEDPGEGPKITEGNRVTYTFTSNLLDGTPCYEATDESPETFTVGKGGVVSGVDEGVRYLSKGSRAILLIPPHLGHGNFGDRNRIPGNSVLIYRLEIKEVR
jgi:FKBP-type peptidyl-prolyl cis-trans isomerase FkpA